MIIQYNFSYRPKDVGRPKAEVAAEFLNDRVPNCNVVPYPLDKRKKSYLILLKHLFFFIIKDMFTVENTDQQKEKTAAAVTL